MPHFEQTLSSETLFEGRVIRVTLDKVRLENGRTSTREVVHHHGGAGIAALDENGNIYLVRQYRYAPDQGLIEIPAGKLEPGEDPWRPPGASWRRGRALRDTVAQPGSIIPTCGYCSEVIYLYAATGLSSVGQHLDED